jgi:molybdopterin biosynthesis enzyme
MLGLVLGTLADRPEEEPRVKDREGKNRQCDHPDVVIISGGISAARRLLDLHSIEDKKLVFLLH